MILFIPMIDDCGLSFAKLDSADLYARAQDQSAITGLIRRLAAAVLAVQLFKKALPEIKTMIERRSFTKEQICSLAVSGVAMAAFACSVFLP